MSTEKLERARVAVWRAALEAGRYYNAKDQSESDLDEGDYARLETLAESVKAFDAAFEEHTAPQG